MSLPMFIWRNMRYHSTGSYRSRNPPTKCVLASHFWMMFVSTFPAGMNFKAAIPQEFVDFVREAQKAKENGDKSLEDLGLSPVALTIMEVVSLCKNHLGLKLTSTSPLVRHLCKTILNILYKSNMKIFCKICWKECHLKDVTDEWLCWQEVFYSWFGLTNGKNLKVIAWQIGFEKSCKPKT